MADFRTEVYNQKNKEWFLSSIDMNQYPPRWWERVFEKSILFEKEKNKDLYNFTTPDILEFYKFLDIGTLTPLIIYNTNLIKYAQWALNENLVSDGQNHFDELDNELLMTCVSVIKVKQSILSYEQFNDLIDRRILNEQDKFIFFCLWEGIKGKDYSEIIDMKMVDINRADSSVKLSSGRTVYVSKRFIQIAEAADQQKEYTTLGNNNNITPLIPDVTIFKEKHNSRGVNKSRTVYNTLVRNINTIDELSGTVSAKTIRDSGLIYYLNNRADKLGIPARELLYSLENCQDLIDKYNLNPLVRKRWILEYSEFLH